jgi:hypothetical protein
MALLPVLSNGGSESSSNDIVVFRILVVAEVFVPVVLGEVALAAFNKSSCNVSSVIVNKPSTSSVTRKLNIFHHSEN